MEHSIAIWGLCRRNFSSRALLRKTIAISCWQIHFYWRQLLANLPHPHDPHVVMTGGRRLTLGTAALGTWEPWWNPFRGCSWSSRSKTLVMTADREFSLMFSTWHPGYGWNTMKRSRYGRTRTNKTSTIPIGFAGFSFLRHTCNVRPDMIFVNVETCRFCRSCLSRTQSRNILQKGLPQIQAARNIPQNNFSLC